MIVCVCRAVCERELERAVASGAHTPDQVEQLCGAGGDCGTCRPDVERIIQRVTLGATPAGSCSTPPLVSVNRLRAA